LWKLHLSIVSRNGWTIGAWMWKHKLCLHPLLLQVTSYKLSYAPFPRYGWLLVKFLLATGECPRWG